MTNRLGMSFVLLPPATYLMGSPLNEDGRDLDEKIHWVSLTHRLYVQTTEVTQGQWKAVMGDNPSRFRSCGHDCPVERVSWDDVQVFIRRLNKMENTKNYRLPTEAEWEYACRGKTRTRYAWGDQMDCRKANIGVGISRACKGVNPGKTARVGNYPPNGWGIYDMHGNVWEWCMDRYDRHHSGHLIDPAITDGDNLYRLYKGGSWLDRPRTCRSANRAYINRGFRYGYLGFRLVMDIPDR
jgi:formylglycine-generating enzyme required for sulfatase activity